jgi:hypothetical protein
MVFYHLQRNVSWSLFISHSSIPWNRIGIRCTFISTNHFLWLFDRWEIIYRDFQFYTLINGCSLCTFEDCFQYWLSWFLMWLLRSNNGISTIRFFHNLWKSIFKWADRIHITAIISFNIFIASDIWRLSNLIAVFRSEIKWIRIIILWTFFFFLLSFI